MYSKYFPNSEYKKKKKMTEIVFEAVNQSNVGILGRNLKNTGQVGLSSKSSQEPIFNKTETFIHF